MWTIAALAVLAGTDASRAGTLTVLVTREADGSPVERARVTPLRDGALPSSSVSDASGLGVLAGLVE